MTTPGAVKLRFPDFQIEKKLGGVVVGVDEVGRGPLAGPVVAAAVIIRNPNLVQGINDSKKLTKLKRNKVYQALMDNVIYSTGQASIEEIDQMNILQATLLAMRRAINGISIKYDHIIIDGNISPDKSQANFFPVISGDSKSLSIAAASIIAKVTRDSLMDQLCKEHPNYVWSKNSGYGTKEHIEAIKKYGLSPHHRKTFCTRF